MGDVFRKIGTNLTLSQKIERNIEIAIREKRIPVGAKLPTERELCESFSVSRTALREALRRLSARGLIKIQKGSGMYVSEIKIEDAVKSLNLYYDLKFDENLIPQIIQVRKIMEPEIAKLAARNANQEAIEEMESSLEEFIACDPDNVQRETDLHNRFHLILAKAARNPIIQITMEPIYSLLPRMRNLFYGNIDNEKGNIIKFHKEIIKAIKKRDEEKAHAVMQKHLERTQEIYDNYLSK